MTGIVSRTRPSTPPSQYGGSPNASLSVLAIGGAQSFGANVAMVMRHAASNVTAVIIPESGHWLMEEAPAATGDAIAAFVD